MFYVNSINAMVKALPYLSKKFPLYLAVVYIITEYFSSFVIPGHRAQDVGGGVEVPNPHDRRSFTSNTHQPLPQYPKMPNPLFPKTNILNKSHLNHLAFIPSFSTSNPSRDTTTKPSQTKITVQFPISHFPPPGPFHFGN